MSATTYTVTATPFPPISSPPSPSGSNSPGGNQNDQPKSSSLYLFTFLSTLFLLLVVSTAIVLRSFLLRRRYHMQLQEQFDDVFRQAGDLPGAPRRRNFGAKPKLWDTWISPDDLQNNPANELVDIKPLSVSVVPQDAKTKTSTSTLRRTPSQERRNERSAAFMATLFANPPPRRLFESDYPGSELPSSSEEISRSVQVSVVISMPTQHHRKPNVSDTAEEGFPNVALGLTRLPHPQ